MLAGELPAGQAPDEEQVEHAVRYFLAELPLFIDTPAIVGAGTSVFCYHKPPAVLRRLAGLRRGRTGRTTLTVKGMPAMATTTHTDAGPIELAITGMTCASCVARVERKLGRLPGVSATVNLATATAHVTREDPGVEAAELIAAVEAIGYGAEMAGNEGPATETEPVDTEQAYVAGLRRRLAGSALLGLPVVVVSMISALHFPGWEWAVLALATPIVAWGAWPFHRAAALNLRHGSATMDALVSLGVLAAYLWSVGTLALGGEHLYLEVAVVLTAFLLAGRFFEARAKRRAGDAIRALMDLGAKDVAVLRDGVEVRIRVEDLAVGDLFVVRPGEKTSRC